RGAGGDLVHARAEVAVAEEDRGGRLDDRPTLARGAGLVGRDVGRSASAAGHVVPHRPSREIVLDSLGHVVVLYRLVLVQQGGGGPGAAAPGPPPPKPARDRVPILGDRDRKDCSDDRDLDALAATRWRGGHPAVLFGGPHAGVHPPGL